MLDEGTFDSIFAALEPFITLTILSKLWLTVHMKVIHFTPAHMVWSSLLSVTPFDVYKYGKFKCNSLLVVHLQYLRLTQNL